MAKTCPSCGKEAWRVLVPPFPMWLCSDDECSTVWGFWSWALGNIVLFDGHFIVLDEGDTYLGTIWAWLTGGVRDEA